MVIEVSTESAADNLVEDLISNEDKECPDEDNPTTGQEEKCYGVQQLVTVRGLFGIVELNLINGVIIPKRSSKGIKLVLAHERVKIVRTNQVPEDPPGDCDHPHHDEHHHEDVINEITSKLTKTPSSIITANPPILDTLQDLIKSYPNQ